MTVVAMTMSVKFTSGWVFQFAPKSVTQARRILKEIEAVMGRENPHDEKLVIMGVLEQLAGRIVDPAGDVLKDWVVAPNLVKSEAGAEN